MRPIRIPTGLFDFIQAKDGEARIAVLVPQERTGGSAMLRSRTWKPHPQSQFV